MRITGLLIIGAIALSFTGCTPKTDNAADVEALRKLSTEDWDKNITEGNVDALADSYTVDAVRIGDGMVMDGREEIRNVINSFWDLDAFDEMGNTVEDVRVSGDLAVVRGRFDASLVPEESQMENEVHGAWVDVCERQDNGEWKMILTLTSDIGEGNRMVAAKYHELDPDDMDAILTEDFVGHNEQNRMNWTREQHKNFWTENKGIATDHIYHQVAEGDWVATWFARKVVMDGKPVEYQMMHFKRFEDGKIAELWEYGDTGQNDSE